MVALLHTPVDEVRNIEHPQQINLHPARGCGRVQKVGCIILIDNAVGGCCQRGCAHVEVLQLRAADDGFPKGYVCERVIQYLQ